MEDKIGSYIMKLDGIDIIFTIKAQDVSTFYYTHGEPYAFRVRYRDKYKTITFASINLLCVYHA